MEEGASQVFPFPELTFSCPAGSAQSVDYPSCHTLCGSRRTLDPGVEPGQCLYVCKYVDPNGSAAMPSVR